MTRTCTECGTALAADAHPRRRFCSTSCRYRHRDRTPERRAADAERHRRRYHADAAFRARHNAASAARYHRNRTEGETP